MKANWILITLLIALLAGCGGQEETQEASHEQSAAEVSWTGGGAVNVEAATSLADLTHSPNEFVGQTVKLEGKIVGVCQGTGCWVRLEDGQGNNFIARSVDHSIAFPKDCMGKTAVVQGEIVAKPAAGHVEEEHDHGEGGHECPAPTYMLSLQGAQVLAEGHI
jgi:hypothetical protein